LLIDGMKHISFFYNLVQGYNFFLKPHNNKYKK